MTTDHLPSESSEGQPATDRLDTPRILITTAGHHPATVAASWILTGHGFRVAPWHETTMGSQLLLAVSPSDTAATTTAIQSALLSGTPLLLIGTAPDLVELGSLHDAIDCIPSTFQPVELLGRTYSLLARRGYLHLLIGRADPTATLLTRRSDAEWVRSRTAIVGLIYLKAQTSVATARPLLSLAIARAHSALDELPSHALSSDDLWNLLLLISLPWTQAEASLDSELMAALTELEHDVTGSRKACLWRGTSPLAHIAGFATTESPWVPSSPDPLREELQKQVNDGPEFEALLAIFRRRLVESDVDRIIEALKQGRSQ